MTTYSKKASTHSKGETPFFSVSPTCFLVKMAAGLPSTGFFKAFLMLPWPHGHVFVGLYRARASRRILFCHVQADAAVTAVAAAVADAAHGASSVARTETHQMGHQDGKNSQNEQASKKNRLIRHVCCWCYCRCCRRCLLCDRFQYRPVAAPWYGRAERRDEKHQKSISRNNTDACHCHVNQSCVMMRQDPKV